MDRFGAFFTILAIALVSTCAPVAKAESDVAETFPLLPCSDGLVVPAQCSGADLLVLLDTGLTGCILDTSFIRMLGPSVDQVLAQTPTGIETLRLYAPPSMRIGSLSVSGSAPVACIDLAPLRLASGHDVRGLIGMSFLQDYVLSIRPDEQLVTISSALLEEPSDLGSRVRMSAATRGVPKIEALVSGTDVWFFTVDTGMTAFGTMSASLYERLHAGGGIETLGSVEAFVASGASQFDFGILDSLAVGPTVIRGPEFVGSQSSGLGLDFLFRFDATLDFQNGWLFLRRNSFSETPAPRTDHRLAIQAAPEGPMIRSWSSEEDIEGPTPQAGDLIRRANGVDIAGLSLACVREALASRPAQPNTLEVLRDGELVNLVIPPLVEPERCVEK